MLKRNSLKTDELNRPTFMDLKKMRSGEATWEELLEEKKRKKLKEKLGRELRKLEKDGDEGGAFQKRCLMRSLGLLD